MNFSLLIPIFFFLLSCGLKTNPVVPGKKNLPSLVEQYKYKNTAVKKKEDKKEKDKLKK